MISPKSTCVDHCPTVTFVFEVHNHRDYLSCYTFPMGINHFNLNFKFKLPSTSSSDASLSDQGSLVPTSKDVSLLLADQVAVPRGTSA